MSCTKDYLSKVLCNAHRSILETLIAAEQFDAAEKYLWGCCEECFVTFDPNKKRFRYVEFVIYTQEGLSICFDSWLQEIHGRVDGERIYACHISVCVSEFLDKIAEIQWQKWRQHNDIEKYFGTPGWRTVDVAPAFFHRNTLPEG